MKSDLVTPSRIRVVCVDDHEVVVEGIESIIGRQPDMELVGSAKDGAQAVQVFRQHCPDVTLMDLQLPIMSGVEAIRAIRLEYPGARIIVLTMFQGDEDIYRALQAGAATYLLKDALSGEMVHTIREVHAGQRPLPPNVVSLLAARDAGQHLTPREVEVLTLLAQGMRNKEIAAVLEISEKTVRVHVKNILAKLDVHDRGAAASVALRRGFIHLA